MHVALAVAQQSTSMHFSAAPEDISMEDVLKATRRSSERVLAELPGLPTSAYPCRIVPLLQPSPARLQPTTLAFCRTVAAQTREHATGLLLSWRELVTPAAAGSLMHLYMVAWLVAGKFSGDEYRPQAIPPPCEDNPVFMDCIVESITPAVSVKELLCHLYSNSQERYAKARAQSFETKVWTVPQRGQRTRQATSTDITALIRLPCCVAMQWCVCQKSSDIPETPADAMESILRSVDVLVPPDALERIQLRDGQLGTVIAVGWLN